jgi:hypothetical protein
MSKTWHVPRRGPKENVRPSGPHKQKDRTPPPLPLELLDEEDEEEMDFDKLEWYDVSSPPPSEEYPYT